MSVIQILTAVMLTIGVFLVALGIGLRQPTFGRYPFPGTAHADAANLRTHVAFLTRDAFPRNVVHVAQLDRAADYIRRSFEATGARVSEQQYPAGEAETRNVIARFGPVNGPLIVVGAHYDVYENLPGADDNASGTAGLMELARLLGARTISAPVELVAYSTEEPPHFGGPDMGSAVHVRSLKERRTVPRLMVCLEMIGYYTKTQPNVNMLLHWIYPTTGDFACIAGRWADRRFAREIKKSFLGATSVRTCSYSGPTKLGIDLSDHRNYWKEEWPAVMITDTAFFRNPNYHTDRDVAETLDYERMAGVVDGVFSAVVHLTESPDL